MLNQIQVSEENTILQAIYKKAFK